MTQPSNLGRLEFVNESAVLNGGGLNGGQGSYATLVKAEGMKRSSGDAGLDMDVDDSDSDSDSLNSAQQHHQQQGQGNNGGLKPGKKTKGRVKIKMEFIENKLRRYTTFSKRKTGIMKKAYELSTLTGTQVMLLVASETGHVYTFATRKLQPMITSESGKALIQTCLNSPDTPPTAPGQQQAVEQRMNPTGFEETELSYAVGDEDQPKGPDSMVPSKSTSGGYCHIQQTPSQSPSPVSASSSPAVNPVSSPGAMTAYVTSGGPPSSGSQKPTNLSMQLPGGGIALLPSGGEAQNIINYMQGLPPGTPISLPVTQASNSHQPQQQAVYRFPTPQPGQILSLQGMPQSQAQNLVKVSESSSSSTSSSSQAQQPQQPQQQQQVTMIQGNSHASMMYQTPQGLVYATAAGSSVGATIPESFIVNLPQQSTGGQQQYITIPVPLSLAHGGATQQMFQPMLAQTGTPTSTVDAQQSPIDRSAKR